MASRVRIPVLCLSLVLGSLACGSSESDGGRTIQGRVSGTGGSGLRVREQPATSSAQVGEFGEGASVTIQCQIAGETIEGSPVWDRVTVDGHDGYVSDAYIDKGGKGFVTTVDRCNANVGGHVEIEGPAVRAHVQQFADAACAAVNACTASTYEGHEPSADLALDLLISDAFGKLPTDGNAFGDRLAEFALANQDKYRIDYVIFRQRINFGQGWAAMEDRGSITQNHYDHVHVSFNP